MRIEIFVQITKQDKSPCVNLVSDLRDTMLKIQTSTSVENLPLEMVELILTQPGLEGIYGLLRQVCKQWKQVIVRIIKNGEAKKTKQILMAQNLPLLQWAWSNGCP